MKQAQEQTKEAQAFADEEEPEKKSPKEGMPQKREERIRQRWFIAFLVGILAAASIQLGLYARSHNPIPEMLDSEPGYLPVSEYALIDTETGEKVQIMTNADYTSENTFTFGIKQYETARGVRPGDSWETFVNAYGDCIPEKIEIDRGKGREEIEVPSGIRVDQFDQEYIQNGLVNFTEDEVSVQFFTGTDGLKLYYSQDQFIAAQDAFNDSSRILHPLQKYDDYAGYRLSFYFDASTLGPGDLQLISSSRID